MIKNNRIMKEVIVKVGKLENNYAANIVGLDGFVCTADSYEELKVEVAQGLEFHLEGLREDGDPIPEVFINEFEFVFKWDIESLLFYYNGILSFSAIEKLSGINQTQLGHYAAGRSKPRKKQIEKVEEALHKLGEELMAVSL